MALERLQKILAERGIASRRKAEELIAGGKVKVNGRPASLGDKADPRHDRITVSGKAIAAAEEKRYILLHKPRGYITTMRDERGRKCVEELVRDAGVRAFPVGRLDRESEGMLLLTNDGDFANAIMHPSAHVEKHYRVTLRSRVTDEQRLAFQEGIELDGRRTAPAEMTVLQEEPGRTVVGITLREGRNRQIRRMCEQLNLEVIRLKRTSIGPVKLGMLPPGKWRDLTPQEVKALVMAAHVEQKVAAAYIKKGRAGQKGGNPRADHRSRR